ncbi:hypothetical protein EJ07DRAFT_157136 [Lizonia empirigonia]|nr:hypothetical protein EJ07DRAFT_157136 [Lizonia empirigonia]
MRPRHSTHCRTWPLCRGANQLANRRGRTAWSWSTQWMLASKEFWNDGLQALRRSSTELHLHVADNDIYRPTSIPDLPSELWYQLPTKLNVFVRLDIGPSHLDLPSSYRVIASPHASHLASLATCLARKGKTKELTITIQENFIMDLTTTTASGRPPHLRWSGVTMPRAVVLRGFQMFLGLMPQLQVFEIAFREALDEKLLNLAVFANGRQAFHSSLQDEVTRLDEWLTLGMTLEIKKVDLQPRDDPSHLKIMHADWRFIFRRE